MSHNFQPTSQSGSELPVPSTGLQAALLLVKLLFPAEPGEHRPEAKQAFALFSRALGKADSFAYQIFQKFEDRGSSRPRGSEATDFQRALRWLLPRNSPERPDDPRGRFCELARTARDKVDSFEAVYTFHNAASSMDTRERIELLDFVVEAIEQSVAVPFRQALLKGMFQHFVTDFGFDGPRLAHEVLRRLTLPTIRRHYERTDLLFNQALALASMGTEDRSFVENELDSLSAEELALAAYMLVVRLGALPGYAWEAKRYLTLLETKYSARLSSFQDVAFVQFASRYDYGVDLAHAIHEKQIHTAELLPLLAHGLALVGDGSFRRKRGQTTTMKTSTVAARTISRRFCAWGRAHQLCHVMVRTPIYDARLPENTLSRDVHNLATLMMKPPLCASVAKVLLHDVYRD